METNKVKEWIRRLPYRLRVRNHFYTKNERITAAIDATVVNAQRISLLEQQVAFLSTIKQPQSAEETVDYPLTEVTTVKEVTRPKRKTTKRK